MEEKQLVVPISNTPMNPPNQTIYIQNLPEKLRLRDSKRILTELFSPYGNIVQLVVKKNIHLRGQAFITFETLDQAKQALKEMQSYPFYFKPMFINYARFKSYVVSKVDGSYLEEKRKQDAFKYEKSQKPRVTRRQAMQQLLSSGAPLPNVMPHIPSGELPNKVLFLQDVPLEVNEEKIKELFCPFAGYKEVRLVTGKADIAFVEFDNELQSTLAKNALNNFAVSPGKVLKVSYARK